VTIEGWGRVRELMVLSVMTGLLASGALMNGYPLVYPDTWAYLLQAIEFQGEASRPPYYSLFIFPLHAKVTLWTIPIVQALVISTLILLCWRRLVGPGQNSCLLLLALLLTVGTSLPWYASQISPDVFAGALILCIFLIGYCWKELGTFWRILVGGMMVLATSFHHSHLFLGLFCALVAAVSHWLGLRLSIRYGVFLAMMTAALTAATAGFVLYTYALTGTLGLSPEGSRFLLARVIGDRTAVAMLSSECERRYYLLCRHIDIIAAHDWLWFLWNDDSPWGEMERTLGFLGSRREASAIVSATLRFAPGAQVKASWNNFLTQLVMFGTGDFECPCVGDSLVDGAIRKHFAREHAAFRASAQNTNRLPLDMLRAVHYGVVLVSVVAALLIVWRRPRDAKLGAFWLMIAGGVIGNAAITGVLAGALHRYQSRVIWLVVFAAFVGGARALRSATYRRWRPP
jgi:hypothetical protein